MPLTTWAAFPQPDGRTPSPPVAGLDKAISVLGNIAIKEDVSRYGGAGKGHQIDSIEAEVSIADGVEQYSAVRSRNRVYRHVKDIRGLWSFGELVTMLRTTEDIIANSREISVERTTDCTVVRFHSAAEDRLWFISAAGRVFWLDFEGTMRISADTGAIESLTWKSGTGPSGSGIEGVFWEMNFGQSSIAGDLDVVPTTSTYRVVRAGHRGDAEWNLTRYTVLGRYGSTSSVSFGTAAVDGEPGEAEALLAHSSVQMTEGNMGSKKDPAGEPEDSVRLPADTNASQAWPVTNREPFLTQP